MPTTAADVLVRPIMQAATGLPEDAVVNDWAFRLIAGGAPSAGDLAAIAGVVGNFYRAGAAAADRVGNYISDVINRAVTHEIQVFSISAGGSPIYSEAWLGPVAAALGAPLPNEVAGVLSFHGDLTTVVEEAGATRPRARRRGRVYIGPLIQSAITNATPPPLAPAFTLAMRANATVMYDAAEAAGWRWSVWSRADDELYPVVAGWTDNAPDTQRRRGQDATLRNVFTTV